MREPESWDEHEIEMVEFACAQAELLIAAVKRAEDVLAWWPDELAELQASVSALEHHVLEPARRRLASRTTDVARRRRETPSP
jgi:hypothetical protein